MAVVATDMGPLCDDLTAETADIETLLVDLDDRAWATPTPAAGWDVRDQVGHLAFFDDRAKESMTDPEAFVAHREEVLAHPDFADRIAAESRRRCNGFGRHAPRSSKSPGARIRPCAYRGMGPT
jgi:uncharacterized protein (TIGR03083 family)